MSQHNSALSSTSNTEYMFTNDLESEKDGIDSERANLNIEKIRDLPVLHEGQRDLVLVVSGGLVVGDEIDEIDERGTSMPSESIVRR